MALPTLWARRPRIHGRVAIAAIIAALTPSVAFAHGTARPEPSVGTLLTGWELEPYVILGLAGISWAYWSGVSKVNQRYPRSPFPRKHVVAFYGGIAALVAALLSPLAAYDTTLFAAHMWQHMLMMMVAAPLLLLGAPITLILRLSSAETRRTRWIPLLQSPFVRVITFPVLAWLMLALTIWTSHFTGVFNSALENAWIHRITHLWYMTAGLLFWWPVVGEVGPWRLPHPLRLLYLFIAMPQNAFVGTAIYDAKGILYQHYATIARNWGPSPQSDQELAGITMWVFGDLLFLAAMGFIAYGWVKSEERSTRRQDFLLARERAAAAARPATEEPAAGGAG